MKAKIFIDMQFLEIIEKFRFNNKGGFGVNKIAVNLEHMKVILSKSVLYFPRNYEDYVDYLNNALKNRPVENYKEYFIKNAVKNGSIKFISKFDFDYYSSYYLLNKPKEEINDLNTLKNIFSLGINYDFESRITPKTFVSEPIGKDMYGINCINHKCKNVILIEPYIFKDTVGKNYRLKIPNLIILLKELYLNNPNVACHFSIITANIEDDDLVKAKIKEINDGMKNENLKVSVYVHKTPSLFGKNRFLITDYSDMGLQHILDRDGTISCAFLYDENIKENFLKVSKKLDKIRKVYKEAKRTFLDMKGERYIAKHGDILENKLFNLD